MSIELWMKLEEYLRLGISVFPVNPKEKNPYTEHGYKDATTNRETVKEWLERLPDCGWAIPTGRNNGFFVVDVDARDSGLENWSTLIKDKDDINTYEVKTQNGGFHYYFQYPQELTITNSNDEIAKGIDVRGEGGYVVVPPTPNYEPEQEVSRESIAQSPEWLLKIIIERPKESPMRGMARQKSIDKIPEGRRNTVLFERGCALQGSGRSEDEILKALLTLNTESCTPPLPKKEVVKIADSASKYDPNRKTKYENTDLGNAYRLSDYCGKEVRYCHELREWFIWNGKVWRLDKDETIKRLAYSTLEALQKNAEKATGTIEGKALEQWAISSMSSGKVEAMINLAKPLLSIPAKDLDIHPYFLNTESGVICLDNGELLPHEPGFFLTQLIDTEFDPSATCPKWEEFLDYIFSQDEEMKRFIQKAVGYSITGNVDEQVLFYLLGEGANGKSTFMTTLGELFEPYAQRTDINALLAVGRDANANPYVARLLKSRLVYASEMPEGSRFNESQIKDLTGGEKIITRALYKEPFEFLPTHKLWLVGNSLPASFDASHGFWRRMLVIPFERIIPKNDQRKMSDILKEFQEEASGILNWAIEGCRLWKEERLEPPDKVKTSTQEYKNEEDLFQQFFQEELEIGEDYRILKNQLSEHINQWMRRLGDNRPFSKAKIGREMNKRKFRVGGGGNKYYLGARLREKNNPQSAKED